MSDTDRPTSTDELPLDAQEVPEGDLSDDEKLDIALQGSMMTSEPPQLSEPRTADDAPAATRDEERDAPL